MQSHDGFSIFQRSCTELAVINEPESVAGNEFENEEKESEETSLLLPPQISEVKSFPMNREITITLKHMAKNKNILGNINTLKRLTGSRLDIPFSFPRQIQFHITIPRQNKNRVTTKWVDASTKTLAWCFVLGKLPRNLGGNRVEIRFRLYGKRGALGARCYGECFVVLEEVLGAHGESVQFTRTLLPKAT